MINKLLIPLRSVSILLCFFLTHNLVYSQQNKLFKENKEFWYISASTGVQMSGIKNEDFISSNIAPLLKIDIGKWISPEVSIQVGYQGPYFHTIADDIKHYYYYLYGQALFSINKIINEKREYWKNWNIIVHPGGGYFYNRLYEHPNICANIGIMNKFRFFEKVELFFDFSAVMGWDIYQGNKDILPNCSLGVNYIIDPYKKR